MGRDGNILTYQLIGEKAHNFSTENTESNWFRNGNFFVPNVT